MHFYIMAAADDKEDLNYVHICMCITLYDQLEWCCTWHKARCRSTRVYTHVHVHSLTYAQVCIAFLVYASVPGFNLAASVAQVAATFACLLAQLATVHVCTIGSNHV
jgi:hypothetical protein